jgi:hypothetical protein
MYQIAQLECLMIKKKNDKILYFPSCTVTNILHIYSNIIHLGMVVVNKITRIMMRVLQAWGNLKDDF